VSKTLGALAAVMLAFVLLAPPAAAHGGSKGYRAHGWHYHHYRHPMRHSRAHYDAYYYYYRPGYYPYAYYPAPPNYPPYYYRVCLPFYLRCF